MLPIAPPQLYELLGFCVCVWWWWGWGVRGRIGWRGGGAVTWIDMYKDIILVLGRSAYEGGEWSK